MTQRRKSNVTIGSKVKNRLNEMKVYFMNELDHGYFTLQASFIQLGMALIALLMLVFIDITGPYVWFVALAMNNMVVRLIRYADMLKEVIDTSRWHTEWEIDEIMEHLVKRYQCPLTRPIVKMAFGIVAMSDYTELDEIAAIKAVLTKKRSFVDELHGNK